jgi:hypothetical protein
MVAFDLSKKLSISSTAGVIKNLSSQIFILVFSIVLIIIVIFVGLTRIPLQLEKLKSDKVVETSLNEKLSVLQQVETGVLEKSSLSLIALPDKNPAPFTISILKTFAEERAIIIDNIKVGKVTGAQGDTDGIKIIMNAKSDGGVLPIGEFIQDISEALPISTVDVVKISKVLDDPSGASFKLELVSYWADLPEQIPPISEPIQQLSQNENSLLENLSNLKQPEFTVLAPSESKERETPFN